jgi:hypothetical protein
MEFPYAPAITVPNPATLTALVSVTGLSNGCAAFSENSPGPGVLYLLQTSSAVVDGTIIVATLNDSSRRWILWEAPSGSDVSKITPGLYTSVSNGGVGNVTVDVKAGINLGLDASGNLAAIPSFAVNTPAALAALPVAGNYGNGQTAVVLAARTGGGPATYVLQPAISSTPDGFLIIATNDDASKQWVSSLLKEQANIALSSAEIDLTVVADYVLVPPVPFSILSGTRALAIGITQKDGTVTTGPTMQGGTDATFTNLCPSTVQATIAAAAVNSLNNLSGNVANIFGFDMSSHGIKVRITSGAVLGTATVFKGRIVTVVGLM